MAKNRATPQGREAAMPPGKSGYPLPRPPDKPDEQECCNRGCCPCIFDYYDDALERWKTVVARLGADPDQVLKGLGR